VLLDKVVEFYFSGNYTLVTNAGNDLTQRTYPRGLDVEVFPLKYWKMPLIMLIKSYQREHVTPYMYELMVKVYTTIKITRIIPISDGHWIQSKTLS